MIKIPIISKVDLSAMGSKAWDGCLQARGINVLHSIMRLIIIMEYSIIIIIIIIIIIVIIVFQLK